MLDNLWIEKFRPLTLNDIVLEPSVLEFFRECERKQEIPHLLFISAPGTGKTSLAKIIPKMLDVTYRYINASDERGIDTIREKVINFAQTKSLNGKFKIIILDETDGLTPEAQRALRNTMEEYYKNVRFILTANYKNRIINPIRSRTQIFEIIPPFDGCVQRVVSLIKQEGLKVSPDQKERLKQLIKFAYPDLRRIIGDLQKFTINGELKISEIRPETYFASKVYDLLEQNKNINEIRKFIIENELNFNSDYLILLKSMFEHIFSITLEEEKKRNCMLTLGKYMESHQQVMDFEINAFCCMIQLLQILN